jgi:hypothetical protein
MLRILIVLFFLGITLFAPVTYADWSQDGGNAQRTGYTAEEPVTPWTYKWSFNGSDSTGGTSSHFYNAPNEARTITGGGRIYIPAGPHGVYALNLINGAQVWRFNPVGVRFNATPAYDSSGFVYISGSNGTLYKLSASTGTSAGTYIAGSGLNKAVLLVGSFAYVVSDDGRLHKVNTDTMTSSWVYTAGSTIATSPSYSTSRDSIMYGTDDLFLHAVNNTDGSRKWRVKPSPNTPGDSTKSVTQTYSGSPLGNQFERGWPVVADASGVVFIRMQLRHQAIFEGLNSGKFGNTNAENKTWLMQNPQWKNLFALNLDDGSEKFIPAVGYGSTEDFIGTEAYGVMGTQPVVKQLANGKEVVYIPFRNFQGNTSDFRWSGHMGEMVLDDTTVSGLSAGDLRFVNFSKGQLHIIDEQNQITVAGDTIFHAHWSSSNSVRITNRSDSVGLSFVNPIQTSTHPFVIRSQRANCSDKNTSTHFTTCNAQYLTDGGSTGDGRFYGGSTFWGYFGVVDPPGWVFTQSQADSGGSSGAGTAYSAGFMPRYTYVSNGYMVVEGNGGDIMVFQHTGIVGGLTPTPTITAVTVTPTVSPTPILRNGDINNDGQISVSDIVLVLQNWLASLTTAVDQYGDGRINAFDFARVVAQLPQVTSTQTPTPGSSQNFALQFDGNDDVAKGAIYSQANGTQTMEVWVKPVTNNAYGMIMHTRNEADNQGWLLELRNGQAELWIADTTGTDRNLLHTGVTMLGGQWYHIAATYNSATRLAQIFVNGIPSNVANLGELSIGPSFNFGTFGGNGFTVYKTCSCFIDEVRISKTIRYTAGFTRPSSPFVSDANTVVLYHFDQGNGQTILDSTGNGQTLTLGATANGESSDPIWAVSDNTYGNTVSPTATPTKPPAAAFPVQVGFNDNITHQLVRTDTDKLYLFAGLAEGSTTLKAYWTQNAGFPTTSGDFSGTAQIILPAAIISVDTVYDGDNMIHVLANTQGGQLIAIPFDVMTNSFKTQRILVTGNPTRTCNSDPCYLGTQGISAMLDSDTNLHIAYRGPSDQILHRLYTYMSASDTYALQSGPTRVDESGSANHPALAVSPLDNSVTISWVSQAGTVQILARTRDAGGTWTNIETVNNQTLGSVWVSNSYGVNVDQGPSLFISTDGKKHLVYMEAFDTTGDYGRMHYATQNLASNSWSVTETPFYSHAAAVIGNAAGDISIIGHGHPNNAACTSMNQMCALTKPSGSTSWQNPKVVLSPTGSDHFDASVSVKWSIVGWNRPDVVEFLFFRANGGSYGNTTVMYGRF